MIPDLTPAEVATYYQRVIESGIDGLKEIEIFQVKQLKKYAEGIQFRNIDWLNKILIANPDYDYPEAYKNKPKTEYWKKTMLGFHEPDYVISIVDEFLATSSKNSEQYKAQQNKTTEIEIWFSEYELRQFIHIATRWTIEGVFKSRTDKNPFTSIFDPFVKNAREYLEKFRTQLNKRLTENQNWKAIEIDLKDRFLPMLNQYLQWYEVNKIELEKFQPHCPYTLMQSVIESTRHEILKYFPETPPLPPQTETKTDNKPIEIKPTLKPEALQTVFDILKDFFTNEHQTELKTILENGSNASTKLLFKANGNRLTDTFKKLIENDFITGCQKQDLIQWIISNFNYLYRNEERVFVFDTVEKIISRNDNPCKRPLIEITKNQIQKA